jgi:hypothetical protein
MVRGAFADLRAKANLCFRAGGAELTRVARDFPCRFISMDEEDQEEVEFAYRILAVHGIAVRGPIVDIDYSEPKVVTLHRYLPDKRIVLRGGLARAFRKAMKAGIYEK